MFLTVLFQSYKRFIYIFINFVNLWLQYHFKYLRVKWTFCDNLRSLETSLNKIPHPCFPLLCHLSMIIVILSLIIDIYVQTMLLVEKLLYLLDPIGILFLKFTVLVILIAYSLLHLLVYWFNWYAFTVVCYNLCLLRLVFHIKG